MSKKQPLEDLAKHAPSSRAPAPVDPIEAAKAGGEADDLPPAADSALAHPAEEPVIAEPAEGPLPVPEPPAGVIRTPGVYVVHNRITVSWGLQTLNLKAGDEISEDSYGDGAIERMRSLGVSLKEKA